MHLLHAGSVVLVLLATSCRARTAESPQAAERSCSSGYPKGIPQGESMQISLSYQLDDTFTSEAHQFVPETMTALINERGSSYGTSFFLSDGTVANLILRLSGGWDATKDHGGLTVTVWGQEDIQVGAADLGPSVQLFTFSQEPLFVTTDASLDDAAAKFYHLVTHGWTCNGGVMTPNHERYFGDGPSPWS